MFMLKSQCLILSKEGDSGKNPYVLKKQKKKIKNNKERKSTEEEVRWEREQDFVLTAAGR